MKNQKWILLLVALGLIAASAALLVRLKNHPRLGEPGIIATPIPGQLAMKIDLPELALDFTSTNVPESEVELGYFPKDTSYAHRIYQAPDGFGVSCVIILMGADRTSIHNADFCLPGQGWDPVEKKTVNVSIGGAGTYQLPVSKWKVSRVVQQADGSKVKVGGVYVFWFVADGEETPSHFDMVAKRLPWHLLRTGVLQRWAYVSYFVACEPGQEDAAFARMEKLIAASVPAFQSPPTGPR